MVQPLWTFCNFFTLYDLSRYKNIKYIVRYVVTHVLTILLLPSGGRTVVIFMPFKK